jgi:hypothetical protein
MYSRAAAISSLPSGAPWQSCDPCLLGAPAPMVVLQQIRLGLSVTALAASRAFSMASGRGR